MFFWNRVAKKIPEDLKTTEDRLRVHAGKMPGPSEEFLGRLESRLDGAWANRKNEVGKPFLFIPQVAFVCGVIVFAFFAAQLTTHMPQRIETVKKVEPQERRTFEQTAVPKMSSQSFAPSLDLVSPSQYEQQESVQLKNVAGAIGLSHEGEQLDRGTFFFLWFIVYLFGFSALLFLIVRVFKNFRR